MIYFTRILVIVRSSLNFKALTAVFAVLAVVFIASTGFLAVTAGSTSRTVTQTVTSTATATATLSPGIITGTNAVGIAYSNSLGFYLTNGTGWTLYLFTKDTPGNGVSTCYGQCETFWSPFTGSIGSLSLPPGLSASSFGTITRTDGTHQITYEGWPLYYYLGDKAAGQTNGQNKDNTWFVVNVPSISIPSTTSSTTATTSSTTTQTSTSQTSSTSTTSAGYGY